MNLEVQISREFETMTLTLYSNNIMHVLVKKDSLVSLQDAKEVIEWVGSIGGEKKYVNLMEAQPNSEVDADARAYIASENQNKYTIADGMVVESLAHRLLSNFYMKFNKPVKPTRVFTNREKAIQWLLQQKQLYSHNC